MQKFILALVLSFSLQAFAESGDPSFFDFKDRVKTNRRAKFRAGINLYGWSPIGAGGVSFDYFITRKLALEIGGGARNLTPDLGCTIGGRYHFFGKTPTNLTPYIGVYTAFSPIDNGLQNYNFYVPVGIHKIKKNRISWSVEVAYQQSVDRPKENFYGGARLGFRF